MSEPKLTHEEELAIAQFTGWAEAVKGRHAVLDLVESMGLTAKEWSRIKEDVRWLPHRDWDEIEEHFNS